MRIVTILLCTLLLQACHTNKEDQNSFPEHTSNKNNAFAKAQPVLDTSRYNVAFLIMDGTFNTELTAPFDIFQHTI